MGHCVLEFGLDEVAIILIAISDIDCYFNMFKNDVAGDLVSKRPQNLLPIQNGAGHSNRNRSPVPGWVKVNMLACRHNRGYAANASGCAYNPSPNSGCPIDNMCTRN